MTMDQLNFKTKIIIGFTIIFLLFTFGLGLSIFNLNNVSRIMDLTKTVNQLVKNMFNARSIEKDFIIYKNASLVNDMKQSIDTLNKLIAEIKSKTNDKKLLESTIKIESLIEKYKNDFKKLAENTNLIEALKKKMKKSSDNIFDTLQNKIKAYILEMQNMAIVTGDEISPAFNEILKVTNNLLLELKEVWIYEKSFILYNDPGFIKKFNDKISAWDDINEDMAFLVNTSKDTKLIDILPYLSQQFKTYNSKTMNKIFYLWEKNLKINQNMLKRGEKINQIVQTFQNNAQSKMISSKNFTIKLNIILLILGIFFSIFIIYFIVKTISESIRKVVSSLKSIAEGGGDLTMRLEVKSNDEIGELARWFNDFIVYLHSMVSKISNVIEKVNVSATEISTTVQQQSSIIVEQSSAVSEISLTMQELSNSSTKIADMTKSVSTIAEKTLQETKRGGLAVNIISEKMYNIIQANKDNIEKITGLGKQSKKINEIMILIHKIADRSKLIAFNADLEASSVGKIGRRFGVVAKEIRKLADSVKKSTKEIDGKILGIQKSVSDIIRNSEKESETIQEGVEISANTVELIEKILKNADTTANTAENIALSTQNQKSANDQILKSLKNIDQGAQQTKESIVPINTSAKDLTIIAGELKDLIGNFKI